MKGSRRAPLSLKNHLFYTGTSLKSVKSRDFRFKPWLGQRIGVPLHHGCCCSCSDYPQLLSGVPLQLPKAGQH